MSGFEPLTLEEVEALKTGESVEQWAPLFHRTLTEHPGYPWSTDGTQSIFGDRTYCMVCDSYLPTVARKGRERHFRDHVRQLETWRRRRQRTTEKEAKRRLREVNALRAETREPDEE